MSTITSLENILGPGLQNMDAQEASKVSLTHVLNSSDAKTTKVLQARANEQLIKSLLEETLNAIDEKDKLLRSFAKNMLNTLGTDQTTNEVREITLADVQKSISSIIDRANKAKEQDACRLILKDYIDNTLGQKIEAFSQSLEKPLTESQTTLLRNTLVSLLEKIPLNKGADAMGDLINNVVEKNLSPLKENITLAQTLNLKDARIENAFLTQLISSDSIKPNLFKAVIQSIKNLDSRGIKQFLFTLKDQTAVEAIGLFGSLGDKLVHRIDANLKAANTDNQTHIGMDEISMFIRLTILYQIDNDTSEEPSLKTLLCARQAGLSDLTKEVSLSHFDPVPNDKNQSYNQTTTSFLSCFDNKLLEFADPLEAKLSALTFNAIYATKDVKSTEAKSRFDQLVTEIHSAIESIPNIGEQEKKVATEQALLAFGTFVHQKGMDVKQLNFAADNCVALGLQLAGVQTEKARSLSVPSELSLSYLNGLKPTDQERIRMHGKGIFLGNFAQQMYQNLKPDEKGQVNFGNILTQYGKDVGRQRIHLPGGALLSDDARVAEKQLFTFLTGAEDFSIATKEQKKQVAAMFAILNQDMMGNTENCSNCLTGFSTGVLSHFSLDGGDVTKAPKRDYYIDKDSSGSIVIVQHDLVRNHDNEMINLVVPGEKNDWSEMTTLNNVTYRSSTSIRINAETLDRIGQTNWVQEDFNDKSYVDNDFTNGIPDKCPALKKLEDIYKGIGFSVVTGVVSDQK